MLNPDPYPLELDKSTELPDDVDVSLEESVVVTSPPPALERELNTLLEPDGSEEDTSDRIGYKPISRQRRGASSCASCLFLILGSCSLPSSAKLSALPLPSTCILGGGWAIEWEVNYAPCACA